MLNFSNPSSVLEQFGIGDASIVVDLGSGSGHYSLAAAQMVGETGHVYAIDVQKDMLGHLAEEAEKQGIKTIDVIHADIEMADGTRLQDALADVVIISNTLFQTEDKTQVLTEAKRLLRSRGRLLLIDWSDSHGGLGPNESLVFDEAHARELLSSVGFEVEKDIPSGAHHYGLICRISS